jgi:hypothetical protein
MDGFRAIRKKGHERGRRRKHAEVERSTDESATGDDGAAGTTSTQKLATNTLPSVQALPNSFTYRILRTPKVLVHVRHPAVASRHSSGALSVRSEEEVSTLLFRVLWYRRSMGFRGRWAEIASGTKIDWVCRPLSWWRRGGRLTSLPLYYREVCSDVTSGVSQMSLPLSHIFIYDISL